MGERGAVCINTGSSFIIERLLSGNVEMVKKTEVWYTDMR